MQSEDVLSDLCKWYTSQCQNDWQHHYGIDIKTTDNPGWLVKIDLKGSQLEGKNFDIKSQGDFSENNPTPPWIQCRVEENVFIGAGDSTQLDEIIRVFLSWGEKRQR